MKTNIETKYARARNTRFNLPHILSLITLIPFALFGYQSTAYAENKTEQIEVKVDGKSGATKLSGPYDAAALARLAADFGSSDSQEALKYKQKITKVLASDIPVLKLEGLSDKRAIKAQDIFINEPQLAQVFRDRNTNKPLRNEIMYVKPTLASERVGIAAGCGVDNCYRVDLYNFFYDMTLSAIVDVEKGETIEVSNYPRSKPDPSPALEALAMEIAKNEAAVKYELGRYLKFTQKLEGDVSQSNQALMAKTQELKPLMATMKTTLNNTFCENSRHLCLAPTYVLGDRALWVIVDLTDLKVAGLRWTEIGDGEPIRAVTQKRIEDEAIFKNFCQQSTKLEKGGWNMEYQISGSDGFRVSNVQYKDEAIFSSAKVVDWHVSYSDTDKFGYSDATGCPMFSTAVVVARQEPKVIPIEKDGKEIGFSVMQEFIQDWWPAPCSYRYQEAYEFYYDGSYRPALTSLGRGCGDNAVYRPILRIEYANESKPKQVLAWEDKKWNKIEKESWAKVSEPILETRVPSHKILTSNKATYQISPAFGNGADESGDNPYVYFTRSHADKDEGQRDLVSIGGCCNADFRQGPEMFLKEPEKLDGEGVVLWYVPQVENDTRAGHEHCWAQVRVEDGVQDVKVWPCTSGPTFTRVN